MQSASGDREWIDDQPGVTLGDDPRLRIETFSKVGCVRGDTVERSTHKHGPSLLSELVDAVELECDLHWSPVDHVAWPCAQGHPGSTTRLCEAVIHGEHNGALVNHERDAPNLARAQQRHTLVHSELVEPSLRHVTSSRLARHGSAVGGRANPRWGTEGSARRAGEVSAERSSSLLVGLQRGRARGRGGLIAALSPITMGGVP